jgi:hypothetical protein
MIAQAGMYLEAVHDPTYSWLMHAATHTLATDNVLMRKEGAASPLAVRVP